MRIGPFRSFDIEDLKTIFDRHQVPFTPEVDRDLEKRVLQEYNQQATTNPRAMAGRLDLAIIFVTLSEADFDKMSFDLEKYGIAKPSDGSFELQEEDEDKI